MGKDSLISIPVLSLFSEVILGEIFNLSKPNFLIGKMEIIKEPTLQGSPESLIMHVMHLLIY